MTMLSSVAERLYWSARYLERAEATARLTNAYTQFVLDIPLGSEPGWKSLVSIIDGNARFEQRFNSYTERNVLEFLVGDGNNPGSVSHSISAARENVRTTRDCLPESCWELVNELHLYAREQAPLTTTRRQRFEILGWIVARLQQITGLIHASMTRDQAYRYMRIGTHIECADMTSRVVDVAFATSSRFEDNDTTAAGWLWVNLLRSLSALSAYRREAGPVVETGQIIDLVFKSRSFARSVHFCLNGIDEAMEPLSDPGPVWHLTRKIRARILAFDTDAFTLKQLHDCIDELQMELGQLNDEIYTTWFRR